MFLRCFDIFVPISKIPETLLQISSRHSMTLEKALVETTVLKLLSTKSILTDKAALLW